MVAVDLIEADEVRPAAAAAARASVALASACALCPHPSWTCGFQVAHTLMTNHYRPAHRSNTNTEASTMRQAWARTSKQPPVV